MKRSVIVWQKFIPKLLRLRRATRHCDSLLGFSGKQICNSLLQGAVLKGDSNQPLLRHLNEPGLHLYINGSTSFCEDRGFHRPVVKIARLELVKLVAVGLNKRIGHKFPKLAGLQLLGIVPNKVSEQLVRRNDIALFIQIDERFFRLFRQLIKLQSGLYKILFQGFSLGDVVLIGYPMRDFTLLVGERMNIPLVNKFRSVFSIVDGMSKKRFPLLEALP